MTFSNSTNIAHLAPTTLITINCLLPHTWSSMLLNLYCPSAQAIICPSWSASILLSNICNSITVSTAQLIYPKANHICPTIKPLHNNSSNVLNNLLMSPICPLHTSVLNQQKCAFKTPQHQVCYDLNLRSKLSHNTQENQTWFGQE